MAIERITIDLGIMNGQPCIRGLPIKFWIVYRDVAFHGLTDADVLNQYPELEPDDLVAVREYAAHLIETRTHDEITGRKIMARDRLVHGQYYKGRCRHATVARWHEQEQQFYHWREKMGHIYIETIKYPTDEVEPWWDVFDVVEELLNAKFEIPFVGDPLFDGNPVDLVEFNEEMWKHLK